MQALNINYYIAKKSDVSHIKKSAFPDWSPSNPYFSALC